MGFKALFPGATTKPKMQSKQNPRSVELDRLIASSMSMTTVLLLGATLQGFVLLAVPRFYALLPTILVLGLRFADNLAITFKLKANPYTNGAITKKWTTIIPDIDGNMSDTPGDEQVAILLLAMKVNHPLGVFAPNVKKVGDFANRMYADLDQNMPDNGFLGQSLWNTTDSRGAQEVMFISYWRSLNDILEFSQGKSHRDAWVWWENLHRQTPEQLAHIGISHEMFEAPRSKWEAVSVNMQPTRLGATTYLKKGDKMIGGTVEDKWISPIVEAKGKLRTSKGRLNWAANAGSGNSSEDEKFTNYM